MTRVMKNVIAVTILALALPVTASAQASRTWVSGVGDDANPCSRTAPCKTFAGAISKTAPGGEISVLDPGGFGAVTITKSITINGDGGLGSIVASLTTGVIINALSTDTIILRNLSINGVGNGTFGIRYLAGGSLTLENVYISGFNVSSTNILVSLTHALGSLTAKNVTTIGGATGISATTTVGNVRVSLDQVVVRKASGDGIKMSANANATVTNSVLANNGTGVHTFGGSISVENSIITGNATAGVSESNVLRVANNGVYDNGTAFTCSGGVFETAGNNRVPTTGNQLAGNCAGIAVPIPVQ